MSITDLYIRLFGKEHIQDGSVIDMAEHARGGGTSLDQGYKVIGNVDLTLKYIVSGQDVYVGESAPGTLSSTAKWRAYKFTGADGTITYADGNANFDNTATDLTALTYS